METSNWQNSELAKERKAELEAAEAECKRLGINPKIAGFMSRHAYRGPLPQGEQGVQFKGAESLAIERYNAAWTAWKATREEVIWNLGRENTARQIIQRGWQKEEVLAWMQRSSFSLHVARQFAGVWNALSEAPFQITLAEIDELGL